MLSGKLYLVEFYSNGRGGTEAGYYVARNDEELVAEFDDTIKSLQMLGPTQILGFFDDAEPSDDAVEKS